MAPNFVGGRAVVRETISIDETYRNQRRVVSAVSATVTEPVVRKIRRYLIVPESYHIEDRCYIKFKLDTRLRDQIKRAALANDNRDQWEEICLRLEKSFESERETFWVNKMLKEILKKMELEYG
jgi:hypothetical protein